MTSLILKTSTIKIRTAFFTLTVLCFLICSMSFICMGQETPSSAAAPEKAVQTPESTPTEKAVSSPKKTSSGSLFEIIAAGGMVGLVIGLLSLAAVTLGIEQALSLQKEKLIPPEVAQGVLEQISKGQIAAADTICRENPSCLSFVLSAGLAECDGDWNDVEKALEDAVSEQSARLFRKVEILSVIGNIAPMLGLLGTVLGMIAAFQEIAASQGVAQGPDLARGIYQALVTTVEGLLVAIPALGAFAFFRSRIDQLMAEVAYTAGHVFIPLKRYCRKNRT